MDALSRLLTDHGDTLRLYARQWLRDVSSSEDALQEALVGCWQRDPGLTCTSLAQVFVCVRNAALNLGRSERRRDVRESRSVSEQSPCFAGPEAMIDLRDEVQMAMARLPTAQREVVTLHVWAGLTFAEISEVLGCSANTAASRYRYARDALRHLLPAGRVLP